MQPGKRVLFSAPAPSENIVIVRPSACLSVTAWHPGARPQRATGELASRPHSLSLSARVLGASAPAVGAGDAQGFSCVEIGDPLCPPGTWTPILMSPCPRRQNPGAGRGQGTPRLHTTWTAPPTAEQLRELRERVGRQGGKVGGTRVREK